MNDRDLLEMIMESKCPATRRRCALELYHRLMEARTTVSTASSLPTVALTGLLAVAEDWLPTPKPKKRSRRHRSPKARMAELAHDSETEVDNGSFES